MRTHGKIATYRHGCRCEDCRRINAETSNRNRRGRSSRVPSGRPIVFDPGLWRDRAACAGEDQTLFFPTGGHRRYSPGKTVCAGCPVSAECLRFALTTHQSDGLWGGLTPDEREQLNRRRAS